MNEKDSNSEQVTRDLIHRAQGGSVEALGVLWQVCRQYLLMLANQNVASDLRPKVAPSDLVQETFLEAQRDFHQFDGTSRRQLLAWLSKLLINNLLNHQRMFRQAKMRQLSREVVLDSAIERSEPAIGDLPLDVIIRQEDEARLKAALERLSDDHRRVLRLRHQENRSFEEIGRLMNRSPEAARLLWYRAVNKMGQLLT